eukprot:391222_1
MSRLYDVLHFGIVKSGRMMGHVKNEIMCLELTTTDKEPFINVFVESNVKVSFGRKWKANLLNEKSNNSFHWTGPIWRKSFLLMPQLFAVWEPLLTIKTQSVVGMHFWVNIQRF